MQLQNAKNASRIRSISKNYHIKSWKRVILHKILYWGAFQQLLVFWGAPEQLTGINSQHKSVDVCLYSYFGMTLGAPLKCARLYAKNCTICITHHVLNCRMCFKFLCC